MKTPVGLSSPVIKTRLLTAVQSLGAVGKSTVAECAAAFARTCKVSCRVADADEEHRTLSYRDQQADPVSFREPDDLLRLIRRAGKGPQLEIIDIPAQKTDFILATFEKFNLLELVAENQVRITVLLFVADTPAAEESLAKTVESFNDGVDYLVVKNPARYKSRHYEGSQLQSDLLALGAEEIEVPVLTQMTLDELQRAQGKLGRWLSLAEAAQHETINRYSQHEIQFFLNRMFAQFYDARQLLFPGGVESAWKPLIQNPKTRLKINTRLNLAED